MLSNRLLKYYSSLLIKKFRQAENKFIIEGKKLVYEGLQSSYECEIVITTEEFYKNNKNFVESIKSFAIIEKIAQGDVKRLSDTETPQGIFAIFNKKESYTDYLNSNFIVALDNINDPGNLGTILRNCDWFGIKTVLLSSGCAEIYNPKTIRSSMGSFFRINFIENIELNYEIEKLNKLGYVTIATDLDGDNIYNFNFPNKAVVIFSNEANGPDINLLNAVKTKLTIPKFGGAESLNVATASAIILSEYRRRNPNE